MDYAAFQLRLCQMHEESGGLAWLSVINVQSSRFEPTPQRLPLASLAHRCAHTRAALPQPTGHGTQGRPLCITQLADVL